MFQNQIRLAILAKFSSQSGFAENLGVHESKVSKVLRDRRKLEKEEAVKWSKALNCDLSIFEPVIKS